MTPAEAFVVMTARVDNEENYREYLDALNGFQCSLMAAINSGQPSKPSEYMITRGETEKESPSAETIDMALQSWAIQQRVMRNV